MDTKKIFNSSVNTLVEGYFYTLFLQPISPYWYLYSLFFVFCITPTFKRKKDILIVFGIVLCAKIISFFVNFKWFGLNSILSNEIWFVLGMVISYFQLDTKKCKPIIGIGMIISFCLLSIITYDMKCELLVIDFLLGVLGCLSVIILFVALSNNNYNNNKILQYLSQYTMPIYLLHTIFAAPIRIVLIKLGVTYPLVHILLGIGISIVGPIIAAKIMSMSNFLEFLLYPNKYIKLK